MLKCFTHVHIDSVQKNSKPENVESYQQDYMMPDRLKRKAPTMPNTNSGHHTISRRQEDMMDMQLNMMNDIARTFNTCVCGVPPIPEKCMHVYM